MRTCCKVARIQNWIPTRKSRTRQNETVGSLIYFNVARSTQIFSRLWTERRDDLLKFYNRFSISFHVTSLTDVLRPASIEVGHWP